MIDAGAGRGADREGSADSAPVALRRRLLLAAVGLVGAAGARASVTGSPDCGSRQPLPARLRLEYDARAARGALALDGENALEFTADGARYRMRSATHSVLFSAEQESFGELAGEALVPHEFRERSGRRPPRTMRVDWRNRLVRFSTHDADAPTLPLLQDRLSLLLTLGLQLRAQAAPGAVELPVAGARRVSIYRFEYRGAGPVELPAGRFETHRLERPLSADDDGLELWIAPALCWLPVWMRFVDHRRNVIQTRLRAARFD